MEKPEVPPVGNPLGHPIDPLPPLRPGSRVTDAPGKAVLCALAGGAVLTLNDGFVKTLAADLPVGQVLAIRGLFIYIPILLFALRAGGIHTMWQVRSWRGQVLRGVCVIGSSFMFVNGLFYLPLADAIAIAFAGPLFVTALAPLMLDERIGWRRWSAVSIGFLGVVLIVRPGSSAFQWFAVFPLVAALLGGMRDVITRKMAASETTVAVLFVTTTCVALAGAASSVLVPWQPVELGQLKYFAASGVLLGIGHYLLIEAFRLGEAALVSPFKYANVIWAALVGYLMFGDVPDSYTLGGAVVVAISGLYILHRERVHGRGK